MKRISIFCERLLSIARFGLFIVAVALSGCSKTETRMLLSLKGESQSFSVDQYSFKPDEGVLQ